MFYQGKDIDSKRISWHANKIMWNGKRPSDDYNFYSLLGIVQGGMWLQKDFEQYLKNFDLSFGRFSILLSLMESNSQNNNGSELSRRLGVSKATTSKMVKKLGEDNLIEIKKDENDGRVLWYALTRAGKERLGEIIPGYLVRMRLIGANISLGEKKQLIDIISKINFLNAETVLSRFEDRPLSEKAKEIEEYCMNGTKADIDRVMEFLNPTADIPITRVVDYYLGTVKTAEGVEQIRHYLFEGSQIQRNYATLHFARKNEWSVVNEAYKMGLIDYVQAYSK
jgi:DNA-binding MarR family transcriptional regulator